MKDFLKNFLIVFCVLLVIAGVLSLFKINSDKKTDTIGIAALVEEINNGKVKKVSVEGELINVILHDDNANYQKVIKERTESFGEIIKNYGVTDEARNQLEVEVVEKSSWKLFAASIIPIALPLIIIIAFFYFMSRGVQGMGNKAMSFGQTNAKTKEADNKNKKTFKDVAGASEAKEELEEIVDFLKHPKKFADMGAKIPKGVLLMGAPGTGKTLLAKSVAGEADVPFFHISGSEFVEMFVGVGASRVRDLFSKAKKEAPAIVFIDEIDAVGRHRGAGLGGGHDEREQTLNQILVEMDGFDPNIGVIVIAATNRPDVLDPALLRPGRFDRRVMLDLPDIKDREAIINIYSKNKPFAEDVSLKKIAERTPGFTGADLESLINESAILAVRRNLKIIGETEVLESVEKVLLGPERKSRVISDKEKKMTAYHESGHAIVGCLSKYSDPIRKVSIISRGQAGGYTLKTPSDDSRYRTLAFFKDELAISLGGYIVEKMIYGDNFVSTGPSADLKSVTQIATSMVTKYGMSNLGPRTFGKSEEMIFLGKEIHEQKDYSDKTAEAIDNEVMSIINEAMDMAKNILTNNRDKLEAMVDVLMEKETIEQEEIYKLVGKELEK